jgi:hypothetical protein
MIKISRGRHRTAAGIAVLGSLTSLATAGVAYAYNQPASPHVISAATASPITGSYVRTGATALSYGVNGFVRISMECRPGEILLSSGVQLTTRDAHIVSSYPAPATQVAPIRWIVEVVGGATPGWATVSALCGTT